MKNSIVLIALLALFFGCSKSKTPNVPNCINDKIEQMKSEPVRNPAAEVWLWHVDGNDYYYIPSPCCDQYNLLYDSKCNVVCAPSGGMSGMGSGDCPEFIGPIEKTLIWKDPR